MVIAAFYALYHCRGSMLRWEFLMSTASPGNVALIPAWYLERNPKDGKKTISSSEVYFRHNMEPFAMEYSPFVMPLNKLPEALKALKDFHLGKVEHW